MKKSELRTGMWVETSYEEVGIVLLGTWMGDVVAYEDRSGYDELSIWNEDLEEEDPMDDDVCNIIKVYDFNNSLKKGNLIWERKEDKKETQNITINITVNGTYKNIEELTDSISKQIQLKLYEMGVNC
jgi:hypothetical protein